MMNFVPQQESSSQTLLIDADDTLWENNIYFERAIADFISFLNHQERTPAEIRGILNEVERECIVSHRYGLRSFTRALVMTFERLSVEPITPHCMRLFMDSRARLPSSRYKSFRVWPRPSNTFQA